MEVALGRQAVLPHGALEPLHPADPGGLLLIQRLGDVGDVPVAQLDEVLGHQAADLEVVQLDPADLQAAALLIDLDDGQLMAQELERQGFLKSLVPLAAVVGILALIMMWQGMQVFPI